MDYYEDLHELCDTLSEELAEANEKIRSAGGKMSAGDLETIDKLTHALKSIKTTMDMMDGGYSREGRYSGRYSGARNARRNSMGRYSRYSRDNDMIAELRELMDGAKDDRTRQEFQKFIDKMEQM